MLVSKVLRIRYLALVMLVLIFAASAYAFAATNTVANSKAGDGTGTISGFNITNVDYTVKAANPTEVSEVKFTLDTAPLNGQVYIKLNSVPASWFLCTVAGTTATCDTSTASVPVGTTLTTLEVVAVD